MKIFTWLSKKQKFLAFFHIFINSIPLILYYMYVLINYSYIGFTTFITQCKYQSFEWKNFLHLCWFKKQKNSLN